MLKLEKIESIMTKGAFTVELDDSLKKADDIMKEENVHQVPVLENGKLVGIITSKKLNEYSLRQIYEVDADKEDIGYNKISDYQDIFDKNVHIIYPEDSIAKAIEILAKKHIEFLPVVDWDNNLVGIVTVFDILFYIKKEFLS